MESIEKEQWYNNPNFVVNCIMGVIAAIIICSQSFAIGDGISLTLFGSIINHNSIYFLILIYFIFLKFPFGKKYFNYLNVCLIFVYLISSGTSLLTLIQAFSLNTLLSFMLDFFLLIYLIHTFLRGTRIWKDFKFHNSPFNEFTNDFMFYAVVVISFVLLLVNLINTVVISGVIISSLDTLFSILFGRYIFLYYDYLDLHKIDVVNDGNFDEIKKEIIDIVDDLSDKTSKVINSDSVEESEADSKEEKKKTVNKNKTIKKKGED